MGTHPIFESDFDCLTDNRPCSVTAHSFPLASAAAPSTKDASSTLLITSGKSQLPLNMFPFTIPQLRKSLPKFLKCRFPKWRPLLILAQSLTNRGKTLQF